VKKIRGKNFNDKSRSAKDKRSCRLHRNLVSKQDSNKGGYHSPGKYNRLNKYLLDYQYEN
jgi:hypothetical protein